MAHPKGGYWIDGQKVPSVTTVIGQLDKPALVPWAAKLNRELLVTELRKATAHDLADMASYHAFVDKSLAEAPTFRTKITQAADAGTLAHAMIEAWLRGGASGRVTVPGEVEDRDTVEKAQKSFESFQQWFKNYDIHIVGSEENLVSQTLAFGGTPDAWGRVGTDNIGVFDWKTGSGIYAEAYLQVAAYAQLVEEREECVVDQAHIIRFSRKSAAFTHQMLSREQLEMGWTIFRNLLTLHEQRAAMKEMMK